MTRRQLITAVLFILITTTAARAEDWPNTKAACQDWLTSKKQYHSLEECVIDFFSLDPVAVTAGNIGSGSGLALGARYEHAFNPDSSETKFTAKGLYSFNSFYLMSAQYTAQLPKPNWVSGDLHPLVDIVASRVDLRTQDFYGLGPNSALAGHAVYREQLDTVGADAYIPVSSWAGFGGDLHYLSPRIKGVSNSTVPSVVNVYGDTGAPGSTDSANFVEVGVKAGIQKSAFQTWLPWEKSHAAEVQFQHYSQLQSSQHSFNRLSAMANIVVEPSHQLHEDIQQMLHRTKWQNFVCFPTVGQKCQWGSFSTTGLVTASYVASTSSVPFYLQPTLGGADVDGTDTLRGLIDYRFRAPNRLLIQEDFDKTLLDLTWTKKGKTTTRNGKTVTGETKTYGLGQYGFYAFFDAGNVAMNPGDLSMGNLRTDAGIGISFAMGNKILGRVYWGFGAGEGAQFNAKLPSAFSSPPK